MKLMNMVWVAAVCGLVSGSVSGVVINVPGDIATNQGAIDVAAGLGDERGQSIERVSWTYDEPPVLTPETRAKLENPNWRPIRVTDEYRRAAREASRANPCVIIPPDDLGRGVFMPDTWTGGIVPYAFNANVSATNEQRALDAMSEIEANVPGIDFVPRTGEANYISIKDDPGNWSSFTGMGGGMQEIGITSWNYRFIIVHELMHALAIKHEQTRSDRDLFITVHLENIQDDLEFAYAIAPGSTTHGAYDFDSVMHYSQCAFAEPFCNCSTNCVTMTVLPPNEPWQNLIGQLDHMSAGDINMLQFLYPGASCPCSVGCPVMNTTQGTGFNCIQGAIDAAVNGDEIVVAPGTYLEKINFLGKAINLRAENLSSQLPDPFDPTLASIIDGTGLNNSVVLCISGEGAGTVLAGFTITGGTGHIDEFGSLSGGGMFISGSSPAVTGCVFRGNTAAFGGGMFTTSSNPIVFDCKFENNDASTGNGGGMGNFKSSTTVIDCIFIGNSAAVSGGGMRNRSPNGSIPIIRDCMFSGNSAQFGAGMSNNDSSPEVDLCIFVGNTTTVNGRGGGMTNSFGSNSIVTNCTFSGNSATDEGGGMIVNNGSSPTVTNCTFSGNTANAGGGMRNISFGNPTVTNCIFTSNSALVGAGMHNDQSSPQVDGCTFDGNIASDNGGGMSNFNGSNSIVTHCVFSGNTATNDGGGMMINSNSSPTVSDCTFSGNTANAGGGMRNISFSNPSIITCAFTNNSAQFGAGMHNDQSSPQVVDCTFVNNTASGNGGGMSVFNNSHPTLTRCQFNGNTATDEGGGMTINSGSSPKVVNCQFNGNTAGYGGGMHNQDVSGTTVSNCTFSGNSATFFGGGMRNLNSSSPTVTNCTFSGNSAALGGGIANRNSSNPLVSNCILWNNNPDEMFNDPSAPTVRFSNVQGGLPAGAVDGGGNINVNPLFVDANGADNIPGTADDDLRLAPFSPCVDAGHNSLVNSDAIDLNNDGCTLERIPLDRDGNPRFMDDPATVNTGCGVPTIGIPAIVDMGAYEFAGTPAPQILIGDTNGNGLVNIDDLVDVINAFGFSGLCSGGDINGNGLVNIDDLVDVLNSFGGCP